jgi:hypothetical protein
VARSSAPRLNLTLKYDIRTFSLANRRRRLCDESRLIVGYVEVEVLASDRLKELRGEVSPWSSSGVNVSNVQRPTSDVQRPTSNALPSVVLCVATVVLRSLLVLVPGT